MELFDAFKTRESCRAYADTPVDRQTLERILSAACLAPSAGNGQPWRFVAVTNKDILTALTPLTHAPGINHWVGQAPCIIAVWEHISDRMTARYGEQYLNMQWPAMDLGLSVGQLCLAAAGLGLGTCILGCFDEAKVKALLGIPADSVLRVLVTLGHPKEAAPPRDKKRLALDSVAQFIE
ncbi:MAG: hypothetical protein GX653_02040 [Clostridiales bacterium]|nr:hypothetical protein [Clostridiales bacterium]